MTNELIKQLEKETVVLLGEMMLNAGSLSSKDKEITINFSDYPTANLFYGLATAIMNYRESQ